ncbi:MAG TPA: SUMF1/EgtB/PvdO family nonheme iron enzyme [Bacteroidales bacterium]|nr:SUMF1/EgtB/PvdO family nonheme iron enzyme [Bacteroidales bacterium]HPR58155.1 SUMF1/EgtB/PvdO family nonheme iron enzyme [Bacteroidales bacterium]
MNKLLFFLLIGIILSSCKNTGNGELIGVQQRPTFSQPDPYGMSFVPLGTFILGVGEEDVSYAMMNNPKRVTVSSFYMDETEITNNEYRQFVYWVRDSIARQLLGELNPEEYFIEEDAKTGELFDPPFLNWTTAIEWDEEETAQTLEEMFLPEEERFFRKKEIDTRKLNYKHYWIDLQAAARKDFTNQGNPADASFANRPPGTEGRRQFVKEDVINVYPDTLCWIHDFPYSYNEPLTKSYFWHPTYDNYPVVGVNWSQARAFCVWRTALFNGYLEGREQAGINDFRLPTEAEWEWAARGGYEANPFPWGGPYSRNDKGCLLANFKPNRGNYVDDGGSSTVVAGHYPANSFGLYDMAGNVAEWTNSSFDESANIFTWDLNPDYSYLAKPDDPISMKRKIIKGGSWKDIEHYLLVSTKDYEYQDTAKSYIGFRCVMPYLGRSKGDNPRRASNVY